MVGIATKVACVQLLWKVPFRSLSQLCASIAVVGGPERSFATRGGNLNSGVLPKSGMTSSFGLALRSFIHTKVTAATIRSMATTTPTITTTTEPVLSLPPPIEPASISILRSSSPGTMVSHTNTCSLEHGCQSMRVLLLTLSYKKCAQFCASSALVRKMSLSIHPISIHLPSGPTGMRSTSSTSPAATPAMICSDRDATPSVAILVPSSIPPKKRDPP
mmetsp:Transcript_18820/g.31626  ORF Transcript_18820/g.31626 Transcript_18820/m.31626 type:complete len:218 (+) Transcript_18820:2065-2718(+)